jgi:AraC family transcriptional regulator
MEEHLKENIDIRAAILQSGYSTTHFYRIFQALIGDSVMDYIRKRKLSDAAIELKLTKKRLIDVAFDYGFNSQEVFTRAFTKLFGITPGRYRTAHSGIVLFEKASASRKMLSNLGKVIEPRIILEKEFCIIGLKKTVKPGDRLISQLWEELYSRKAEIHNAAETVNSLGICEYMPDITDGSEFDYIACVEVTVFDHIPAGMVTKTIPSSKYAVFTHDSKIRLKDTYGNIYGAWLPYSGYELAEQDTIELYHALLFIHRLSGGKRR